MFSCPLFALMDDYTVKGGLAESSGAFSRSHAWAACSPPASVYRIKTKISSQSSDLGEHQDNGDARNYPESKDTVADHDDVQMG